jgi:hypothetical protein
MNPKECDKLAEVFPPNTAEAKQVRNTTITEMLKYLFFKKPALLTASSAMLTHLLRMADNHHCLVVGRFIVKRQVELSWEYSVLLEIQQVEVTTLRPTRVLKNFKPWQTSSSDRDALKLAIDYFDAIIEG